MRVVTIRVLLLLFLFLLLPLQSSAHGAVLSSPNFVVKYDSVDVALAQAVIAHAERALTQLSSQLQHSPDAKILIIIASSEDGFLDSVREKVPEWGLAFAFSSQSKIVLKSPRLLKKNIDVAAVITHEVSHVMLHSFLGGRDIPLWLNEGFAMYQSKEWRIGNSATVGWAAVTDNLYRLDDLETSFPWSDKGASLAYAESFLAVSYIIQEFGKEGLMGVIADLGKGVGMDASMRKRFGIGYRKFKREWMIHTKSRFSILSLMLNPLTVWPIVIALFVVAYVRRRKRRQVQVTYDAEYDVVVDREWMDEEDDV